MEAKVARRTVIANARREIRALPRPKGVRRDTWSNVQELLLRLACYLPDVWPSERTLAEELHWAQTSLHRTVCKAEELGVLSRNTRSLTTSRWNGMEYLLTCLSAGTKADIIRARPEHTSTQASEHSSVLKVVPSLSEKESSNPPSVGPHGSAGSGLADRTTKEAGVPRWEPQEQDPDPIGADLSAPLPGQRIKPPNPGTTLALYFDHRWLTMAQRSRQWRGSRPSERGKAIGYMKGVMLTQVDEDMARAYIDAFVSAVASGEVEIKEGQLPFERFTGWWGRDVVADPVEEERNRQVREEMRRRRDERLAALDDDA